MMDGGARRDRTADLVNAIFGIGLSLVIPEMSGVAFIEGIHSERFLCILVVSARRAYYVLTVSPTLVRSGQSILWGKRRGETHYKTGCGRR